MKNKLRVLLGGITALSVCLSAVNSSAQLRRHGPNNRDNTESRFTLDYYLKQGPAAGGRINYAHASGEICQSGEVKIAVTNPTLQFRDGNHYPIHGDAQYNAANLFCRTKGLDYARDVRTVEGGKVPVLEAHGNTFEVDGHRTTVSSLECYVEVNEPCKTFDKDINH